jgi:hypothetical protein
MNAPAKEVARTAVSANGLRKASASRCGDRRGHLGVVCDETPKWGNGMSQDALSEFVEATATRFGIPGVAVGV